MTSMLQAERERQTRIRRLEESGRPDRLSGMEREAERLFELVCDRPGITRAEALGVVPSDAGWDDLVACSDIELVALVPGRPAGAFSAVRLIHARDSIMKVLRAARGGWVNVRQLREASPYSNGYRGAAMKTLGCIEFDGKKRYRRTTMTNDIHFPCTHPEGWPCKDSKVNPGTCGTQETYDVAVGCIDGHYSHNPDSDCAVGNFTSVGERRTGWTGNSESSIVTGDWNDGS